LARLAVGGTWGSMRQAEINAEACGSNSAPGSLSSPPFTKKPLHICKFLKNHLKEDSSREANAAEFGCVFKKVRFRNYNPEGRKKENNAAAQRAWRALLSVAPGVRCGKPKSMRQRAEATAHRERRRHRSSPRSRHTSENNF
jgi:plasmid stabilization system protein ParE